MRTNSKNETVNEEVKDSLVLRTTEMFGEVETNIYENADHEMFMTARQLGECLGYSEPTIAINKLVTRHPYLANEEFSVLTRLVSTDGKQYNTRIFNEDGIYEVTFLSDTEKAFEFRSWVRHLLKDLRKGDIQLSMQGATFSPELFETALAKHLGGINDRIIALETKKPSQPNFWLWKKRIVRPAIDNLAKFLNIDTRTAYDTVYDHMGAVYGFDKSFAMSQFCAKYQLDSNTDSVATIDAIADSPEYQREFIKVVNKLTNVYDTTATKNSVTSASVPAADSVITDKVQEIILPLIHKYNDTSANGSRTYRRVYSAMNKSNKTWAAMKTRYHCKSKKDVLLKCDKYYKEFAKAVNQLLSKGETSPV